ncbi:phage tail protein [Paenibacillus pabuli]|uniref:phage tail protein n=1 Tax=Paenibacillus pabuli TaxID=1472 RepID=UPI001FFF3C5E|nr:phage tail protein [Paenibacillus pabuli]UPK45774.1 tail fiber protein [Paenibacillus pabuli]
MFETMYPAAVNSRQTELAAAIDDIQTSFMVLDGSVLPPAPNELTIGTDESAETIKYEGLSGNELTGVTRGFEGVAKSWAAGTKLGRYFTAYDHDTFRGNIEDLNVRLNNIPAPMDASLTDKGIVQLSNKVNGTSQNLAATEKAVNDTRLSIVNDYIRQPGYAVTTGTATAYVVTLDPVPASLPAGFGITIVPHVASGAAPTLNVNGLGAIPLKKQDGTAYAAGDLLAGKPYSFRRVGSDFLADSGGREVEIPGQTEMTVTYSEDIAQGDMVRIYTEPNYRLPDLSERPSAGVAVLAISSDDNYLVVSPSASPFYAFYKRSGDTFVKLPNPTILPSVGATSLRFSSDGVYLYVGLTTAPFLMVYKRSGDTFTKQADPNILPPDLASGIKISNDGIYVSVSCRSTPYIIFYKRSGDTLIKLSDPMIMPPVFSSYVDLSDDGKYYAWTTNSSSTTTRLMLYERTGDTFAKIPDPSEVPITGVRSCSFAPGAKYLTIGPGVMPYLWTYKRTESEFIKMDDMKENLSGVPNDISYYDNGSRLMVWLTDRPYLVALKSDKMMYKLTAWDGPLASINTFVVGKEFIVVGKFGTPFLELYKIRKPTVRKINNIAALMSVNDVDAIGYAKESGAAGDSRKIIALIK